MKVVVMQSNYIPWKGYFDLMASADLFVIYDSVQYTKNDWRNRNILKGSNGPTWLTIPVQTAGRANQRIEEVCVVDCRWTRKHWRTVVQCLGKRSYFDDYRLEWEQWFREAVGLRSLHDINLLFLRGMARQLSITTPIVNSAQLGVALDEYSGSATERLVALCCAAGASSYITGPAGLGYLDLEHFGDSGVRVEVIDYTHYPTYQQLGELFMHGVSALDLLANVGSEARRHLTSRTRRV